jgi:hypothetical protein
VRSELEVHVQGLEPVSVCDEGNVSDANDVGRSWQCRALYSRTLPQGSGAVGALRGVGAHDVSLGCAALEFVGAVYKSDAEVP